MSIGLGTGTISFSDIKNKAEYDSKGYGVGASVANANDETISAGGPSVSVPAHDEAENTTNSAVAKGKINITNPDKQKQDIRDLSRDTENAHKTLGNIFDLETVQERTEMANLFSEMANKAIGDLTLKISPDEKRALNIAAGAITSYLGSGDYLSGAVGVSVTEAMQKILRDVKDPTVKEILVGIASATVGKMTNLHVAAALSSAINAERFNHLTHQQQEEFVAEMEEATEIEDVVQRQEERLRIIEKYYKISEDNRANDPEGAKHMEEALMDILEEITKYGDCGIHFKVNRDAGLHYNLEAAKLFFREFNYAKHLPGIFEDTVIATAATISAPIAVIGKALTYGPVAYEVCNDILDGDGDALFVDVVKHSAIHVGSKYLENIGVPKYIIIPIESISGEIVNTVFKRKDGEGE